MPSCVRAVLLLAALPHIAHATGKPVISVFRPASYVINAGQTDALYWTVSSATSLSINQSVGPVTGTRVSVTPAATTSYTLSATNAFGTVTAIATISVLHPPVISSFQASPAAVIAGQSTVLSWNVTGATSISISPGVGAVTGTSVTVKPATTVHYALTAANAQGSSTVTITLTVGQPPIIASFKANPASITAGQATALVWSVTGAPTLSIDNGAGAVTGTVATVKPPSTTTYTLTATNLYGTATAQVTVTVVPPNLPNILFFSASPSSILPGQSTVLSWSVSNATAVSTTLSISPGVGTVTGTFVKLQPTVTTTYVLTASNIAGSVTASVTVTVTPTAPPTITSFFANPNTLGPGSVPKLYWNTDQAASLTIDQGIGAVTGVSGSLALTSQPMETLTYTLTATNSLGSTTAQAVVSYIPLVTVNPSLYYTEHAVFLVPPSNLASWAGTDSYDSVFSAAALNSYVATLNTLFPDDYLFVVVTANGLLPNYAPTVLPLRLTASGIGLTSTGGIGTPSICRYNVGGGTVTDTVFDALDHEIGHVWGVYLQPNLSDANDHWFSNSTATGQMQVLYSDAIGAPNPATAPNVVHIAGDPANGFTWSITDAVTWNETATFSDQDLYLQGFAATFPDLYVLTSPVYKSGGSVSYSAVAKYDQTYMTTTFGARNPSYQTSPKRIRMAVIYVAQSAAEVQAVYQPIERSISNFVNGEQVDLVYHKFQVPFLVETKFRGSANALLADLDGNSTPTLAITGPMYLTSTDGTATVPFTAADIGGAAPTVSCVPASASCSISNGDVVLTGLPVGSNFLTIKAQDAQGKKTFAHFVVDVN